MSQKMKTSVSLPSAYEENWRQHRLRISSNLAAHLRRFHKTKPRRIGLKQFSNCETGLVRFNVYWDQDTYNKLHAVAHALCMSVSHLLWQILLFVMAGGRVSEKFSNYVFRINKWSSHSLSITETLVYPGKTSKKSTHRTPNIWDKPPLHFTA